MSEIGEAHLGYFPCKCTNDFDEYLISGDYVNEFNDFKRLCYRRRAIAKKTVKMTDVVLCKKVTINYRKNDHISNSSLSSIQKYSI